MDGRLTAATWVSRFERLQKLKPPALPGDIYLASAQLPIIYFPLFRPKTNYTGYPAFLTALAAPASCGRTEYPIRAWTIWVLCSPCSLISLWNAPATMRSANMVKTILQSGMDLVVASVGALADELLAQTLESAANDGGQLLVPSGAAGGHRWTAGGSNGRAGTGDLHLLKAACCLGNAGRANSKLWMLSPALLRFSMGLHERQPLNSPRMRMWARRLRSQGLAWTRRAFG